MKGLNSEFNFSDCRSNGEASQIIEPCKNEVQFTHTYTAVLEKKHNSISCSEFTYEPVHEIFVFKAFSSNKVSDQPVQMPSLVRAFVACICKV